MLEQAEGIHEDPAVLPFAVDDPVDDHAFDGDLSAGGRDSHEGALVGAVPGEAVHDLLASADLLLIDPLLVREGWEGDSCEERLQAFTAGALSRDRIQFDEVLGGDLVDGVDVLVVEDLLAESFDDLAR